MRLMDADALLKEANADGAYGYVDAEQIANAPTIEAEPVKHGYNVYEKGSSRFECSECGYEDWDTITCEPEHHNYCPNCGAKMDLEAPDEA